MKFVAVLSVAAVVGAASAAPEAKSSFVSCNQVVACKEYNRDAKNLNNIARCKPHYPGSTTPCTERFCCVQPNPTTTTTTTPTTNTTDSTTTATTTTTTATSTTTTDATSTTTTAATTTTKGPSFVSCASYVAGINEVCPYGFAQDRCKPWQGSNYACSVKYCCKAGPKPSPTSSFVSCGSQVQCKYGYAQSRCKPRTGTTMPCNEAYCCKHKN